MDEILAGNLLDVVFGQEARATTNKPSRAEAQVGTLASAIGVVETRTDFRRRCLHNLLPPRQSLRVL